MNLHNTIQVLAIQCSKDYKWKLLRLLQSLDAGSAIIFCNQLSFLFHLRYIVKHLIILIFIQDFERKRQMQRYTTKTNKTLFYEQL